MKNATLLCCALLALPMALAADASGSQAAPWLLISNNGRQSALGDVVAATAGDANALGEAPSGLAEVQGQQLAAGENFWLQGANLTHLAWADSLVTGGALGVAVNYQDFGSIDLYNESNGALVSNGSTRPDAWDIDLGWGQKFGGLCVGADAKVLNQSLDGDNASGVGFDVSGSWDFGMGLRLGVAGQNLGPQFDGSDLPTVFAGGLAYGFGPDAASTTLAVDVDAPALGTATVGVGVEEWVKSVLALRLGYRSNNVGTSDLGVSGLTAGVGLKASWLRLDYAWRAEGDLGMANQISVLTSF